MNPQEQVFAAVARRGYTLTKQGTPWPMSTLVLRQVAKLSEELSELFGELDPVAFDTALTAVLTELGWLARRDFDNQGKWLDGAEQGRDLYSVVPEHPAILPTVAYKTNWSKVWQELADVQVVVFVMAAALNRILVEQDMTGGGDIVQAALAKANGDVGRGVR